MVRLHDPKTGRIVNVDEDQAKDFRDLGYKTVKGVPEDETSKASPSKSS